MKHNKDLEIIEEVDLIYEEETGFQLPLEKVGSKKIQLGLKTSVLPVRLLGLPKVCVLIYFLVKLFSSSSFQSLAFHLLSYLPKGTTLKSLLSKYLWKFIFHLTS
jgi:hypothetical protein